MTKISDELRLACLLGTALMLFLGACSGRSSPLGTGSLHASVSAELVGQPKSPHINRIAIDIQPANFGRDLGYNPSSGKWIGTVTVPAGIQTVTATAYSNDTAVGTGSGSITVTAHGTVTLFLELLDSSTHPVAWDHGPIITTVSASTTTPWNRQAITVSMTAADPDGDGITYLWSQDCTGGSFASPTSASTSWSDVTAETCTLTGTATSGTFSDSATLTITVRSDNAPPSLAWSVLPPSATAASLVAIDVVASDSGAGVASVWYQVNGGGALQMSSAGGGHFTASVALIPNADNTITVYGVDTISNSGAGGASPQQITAVSTSDITSPSVAWGSAPPSQVALTSVALDITASDSGVGVSTVWVSVNGGAAGQASYDGGTGHWTYVATLTANAATTLKAWAVDGVGNSGQAGNDITATVKSDTSAPAMAWGTTLPSPVKKKRLSLDIVATDSVTGVASAWVSVNGGTPVQATYNSSNGHYTYTSTLVRGSNSIRSWGVDNVGNNGQLFSSITATVVCKSPCN